MMSNTATLSLHIRNIVKKARDKMECVLRVLQSRKRSLILILFQSLVIPLYSSADSSGIHGRQNTYKLSKLFSERIPTKSLMDSN